MKVGEIYYFRSTKAHGHDSRNKYHIYVAESDWRDSASGHSFLFISKTSYPCDYPIKKSDYDFFELPESYVTCSNLVTYTDDEIAAVKPELMGKLTSTHAKELHDAIAQSEVMEQWQIALSCQALRGAF